MSRHPYPNALAFIRALSPAGRRAVAKDLKVSPDLSDEALLAAGMREYSNPAALRFPSSELARIAAALGVPSEAEWKRQNPITPEIRALPDYKRPSWEQAVYDAIQVEHDPEPARPIPSRRRPGSAPLRGDDGVTWIDVPGGSITIGLDAASRRSLARHAKGDEAAQAGVRELASFGTRAVRIAPFRCAAAPLVRAQLGDGVGDSANPHGVVRVAAAEVEALLDRFGARLLTEAEWEWVARAGGVRHLLCGDDPPEDYVARVNDDGLDADAHPWGIRGLAWGTWVEDLWARTIARHPEDGGATAGASPPETVRGGGLDVWPWQGTGEVVALSCAFRTRSHGEHAVLLARDVAAPAESARPQRGAPRPPAKKRPATRTPAKKAPRARTATPRSRRRGRRARRSGAR